MGFFDTLIGIGKTIAQPFINGGKTVINTIGSAGKSIGSGVGKLFKGDVVGALSEGKNVINTIGSGMQSLSDTARNIPYVGGTVAGFLDPIAGQVKSFGNMGNNLIDKIGGFIGVSPESDQQKQDAIQAQNNMSEMPFGGNDMGNSLYLTKGKFKTQPFIPQPPIIMQQPQPPPTINFAIPSNQPQNEVIRTTAIREPQPTPAQMLPLNTIMQPLPSKSIKKTKSKSSTKKKKK